jgi:alpha-maltose-1-phosphate synthase
MKALLLSNEYPPNIYGGAGVHVDYLSRELAKIMDVEVRCFGDQEIDQPHLSVRGFGVNTAIFRSPKNLNSVFGAIRRCTDFNTFGVDADVVHCHTWYSHFGGILAKLNYHIPMVLTVHSLEPLRPWKREQLGHGYDCSSWLEKTATEMADAVIAVSEETRRDILRLFNVDPERVRIIYNGIDPEEYYPRKSREQLEKHDIDPNKPFILFVGRIARQKGIIHLVNAIKYLEPGYQVVLCAGAPDTPEIAEEMKKAVAEAQSKRDGVIWIEKMVPKEVAYQLYSHAAVFCCPSIYEPFGIINLEAMACESPVVASAVGGIKEVVVDGETGFLVPLEQMQESPFEPVNPDKFSRDFADKVNLLMRDEPLRRKFGVAGRKRAVEKFSWATIAAETKKMYESLQAG